MLLEGSRRARSGRIVVRDYLRCAEHGVTMSDLAQVPIPKVRSVRRRELLKAGRVSAIFPEGLTQDTPQLARIKTGAARIALQAESAQDFTLGLTILPVGLQFYPQRHFRADAWVRIGQPVRIDDLATRYAEAPAETVRLLTDRIGEALKALSLHLEDPDKAGLAHRLTEL